MGGFRLTYALAAANAVLSCVAAQASSQYGSLSSNGLNDWTNSLARARELVAQMTLEEMNNMTYGIDVDYTGCVGVSGGVPRLGFPGLCLQDAGNGIRRADGVSAFASGVSVGASWNVDLAFERAIYMGAEYKRKGVNVILGPVVGPLGRTPLGGRNWEGFGADPYMDGILGAVTVEGLQRSIISSIKHYVGNEQETNRNPTTENDTEILASSSNIDDRTMHEVYAWPFEDMVHAGAACVMCSYQRVNQTYGCHNNETQNVLLKGEYGFEGFIVSDWGAQHAGLESATGGLDMAMPNSPYWNESQLVMAINNGSLERSRLEDMATRIIAAWYQIRQDDPSQPPLGIGIAPNLSEPHVYIDAKDPASRTNILQQAIEGHVLIKNTGSLPLENHPVLSIFGYDAKIQDSYDPESGYLDRFTLNFASVNTTLLDDLFGEDARPQFQPGLLTTAGGSGASIRPYALSPYDVIAARAAEDGTTLFYDFLGFNPRVVASSSACLVFINEFASEGFDRPGLAHADSDTLVTNVAGKCNNTIVTIHNAGIRLVDAWIDHPNVTAVILAHLPGQAAGQSLAQILYGEVSPSGRLPYTLAHAPEDYGDILEPCPPGEDPLDPQCDFTEGVEIDYRSFLARDVEPRFPFGYGLTYSNFSYAGLSINVTPTPAPAPASTAGGQGGSAPMFQSVGTISATVTNTGDMAAAEVAQLYVQIPGERTRALRGFQKVFVQPGASTQVTFNLRRRDVSRWDTAAQGWIVPSGEYQVFVGKSVLDTPLTGSFTA